MTLQAEQIAAVSSRRRKMTYEEFLDTDFPHSRFEWVKGEAVEMAGVESIHGRLVIWLVMLFGRYARRIGGEIMAETFQMRIGGDEGSGRQPDILFMKAESRARMKDKYFDGPADLVIEIVSPSSRMTDRRDKFREYAAGGVPEYWILDPMQKRAEFFQLENGAYEPGAIDDAGIYRSRVLPQIVIDPQWFWDMPDDEPILAKWLS